MSGPRIGMVLSRLVVPAWILSGAIFKLVEATPKNLPAKTILALGDKLDVDLFALLAVLIGLEFFAAVIMLMVARLARPMAIFMLSVFCLVLIGEMVQGNVTSCGCLGSVTMPPWAMLAIDGAMLFGVLLFDPTPIYRATSPRWPLLAALILSAAGMWWSFHVVMPTDAATATNGSGNSNLGTNGGTTPPVTHDPTDPTVNPQPLALPPYWLSSDLESWKGKPWREIELLRFMPRWPRDLDAGTRYVVFYNRTCDHCETMFNEDLTDPALGRVTAAVEVPDSKTLMTSPNAWFMPQTECERLELPLGPEWIITTPLTIALVDGVVTCVEEGDHKACMGLE